MFVAWLIKPCASTLTTCCTLFAGGNVFHHTSDLVEVALTESTLQDYIRFQSGLEPRPSGVTINARVAVADRAIRNQFPNSPCQIAPGFHQSYLRRRPMGLGRPRLAISRLRVKTPKRAIVPLSIEEGIPLLVELPHLT